MFSRFGVENFKAFKNNVELDIAPLTILTGTNSSGKSSFTQALRLFKSLKEVDTLMTIKGDIAIIGDFNTIRNNTNKPIIFKIPIKYPGLDNPMEAVIKYELHPYYNSPTGYLTELIITDFKYEEPVVVFSYKTNGFSEYTWGDYPGDNKPKTYYQPKENKITNISYLIKEFEELHSEYKEYYRSLVHTYNYLTNITGDENFLHHSSLKKFKILLTNSLLMTLLNIILKTGLTMLLLLSTSIYHNGY